MSQQIQAGALKHLFIIVRKYEDTLRVFIAKKLREHFKSSKQLANAIENERKTLELNIKKDDIMSSDRLVKIQKLQEITDKNRIWSIYSSNFKGIRFYDLIVSLQIFSSLFDKYIRFFTRDTHQFFFYINQTKDIRNSFSHDQLEDIWQEIKNQEYANLEEFDFNKVSINLPPVSLVNFMYQSFRYFSTEHKLELELEFYLNECEELISVLASNKTLHNLYEIEDQFKSKFIKRETELNEHLIKYILKGHRCSYAILGMGGVGKSRLAYEFAIRVLNSNTYNFLFWISSKEEEIKLDISIGYKISTIKAKFKSFDEFVMQFGNFKGVTLDEGSIINFLKESNEKGIIIFDNFDNLDILTRKKVLEFIDNIQNDNVIRDKIKFILTSRENEAPQEIEGKIRLSGFLDEEGASFITEYCENNSIIIDLGQEQVKKLVKESMGVTLILVMALEAIYSKTMDYEKIINILEDSSSTAIKELGEYFFRETVDSLVRDDENIKNILLTLYYYEGADVIDISRLTHITVKQLELDYLPKLSVRYVVQTLSMGYALNDFAAHYVYYNFIVGYEQEVSILHREILSYQSEMDNLLKKYDNASNKSQNIIKEWHSRNKAEKIANYMAYFTYLELLDYMRSHKEISIDNVVKKIDDSFDLALKVQMTPYVLFQHAASLSKIFDEYYNIKFPTELKDSLVDKIINLYESARSLCFSNKPILKEKSYPAMLYRFGMLYKMKLKDFRQSLRLFKDAISLLKLNNHTNEVVFYQVCFDTIDTLTQLKKDEQTFYEIRHFSSMFTEYTYTSKVRYCDYLLMKNVADLMYLYSTFILTRNKQDRLELQKYFVKNRKTFLTSKKYKVRRNVIWYLDNMFYKEHA